MFRSIGGIIYIIIGLVVANSHGYLGISDIGSLVSAILAILLWPLILFGVDLHVAL
ncbi:MAG: hypothetical protein ACR2FO_08035 [Actinomycetota bacterium]